MGLVALRAGQPANANANAIPPAVIHVIDRTEPLLGFGSSRTPRAEVLDLVVSADTVSITDPIDVPSSPPPEPELELERSGSLAREHRDPRDDVGRLRRLVRVGVVEVLGRLGHRLVVRHRGQAGQQGRARGAVEVIAKAVVLADLERREGNLSAARERLARNLVETKAIAKARPLSTTSSLDVVDTLLTLSEIVGRQGASAEQRALLLSAKEHLDESSERRGFVPSLRFEEFRARVHERLDALTRTAPS